MSWGKRTYSEEPHPIPLDVKQFYRAHYCDSPVWHRHNDEYWWRIHWRGDSNIALSTAHAAGFENAQVVECYGTLLLLKPVESKRRK